MLKIQEMKDFKKSKTKTLKAKTTKTKTSKTKTTKAKTSKTKTTKAKTSKIKGGTSLSDPQGGPSQGKINPFFFSVANTSNGSKIYLQAPNASS